MRECELNKIFAHIKYSKHVVVARKYSLVHEFLLLSQLSRVVRLKCSYWNLEWTSLTEQPTTRHFRPLAYIPSNGTLYIFTKIEVTNEESIENFSLELIHVLTNT